MIRWLALCFVACVLSYPASAAVFNPKTMLLPNGLQVVVVENPMAPVVTHMMWIKAGAADEPHGKSGVAHYLEHLMFKGTKRLANGEYSRRIAQLGGNDNAFTSADYTAYFATLAPIHLPAVMEMEADRLVNLRLTQEIAAPELNVVLDEYRQRVEDNPFAPLQQQLAAALFPHHPYGIPIIGWKKEIESLTVEDAIGFYEAWYQPSNTIVVISGDVKAEDVFAQAKKTYGSIPSRPALTRSRVVDPDFKDHVMITRHDPRVKETTLLRTYKVPSARQDKQASYALELLETLLDGSQASFLSRILVQEKQLASSVSVEYEGDALDAARLSIALVPKTGVTVAALIAGLDSALNDYASRPPSPADMQAAISSLKRQAILARDSVMGPAQIIGSALATGQTLEDIEAWPERISAVQAQQVQNILKSVLQSPHVTGVLQPAGAAP